MNFANLSWPWLLAGGAALAGLLYVLQQLRIRYTEVAVPTAMFWREAARDAPVRVFRRRFRHWLAYLLCLLICWLLWLGLAEPRLDDSRGGQYHVLFLDGSAHMSGEGDLALALERLRADLRRLPQDRREVIWGGAWNLKLLSAGEESLLLERRIGGLEAEAAPSALEQQLELLRVGGAWPDAVRLVVYGRAPVRAEWLERLPEGVEVERAEGFDAPGPNRGIVALGQGHAASGRWDAVDVLVRIVATGGLSALPEDLEVSLDGEPLTGAQGVAIEDYPPGGLILRGVPADGGLLEARIVGEDALPSDNLAQLRLPERRTVPVAVSPALGALVEEAVRADSGLALADGDARVAFRLAGEDFAGALPALEFAPMDAREAAFEIRYAGNQDVEQALRDSLRGLGLDLIDGAGLAAEAGRPVSVQALAGDSRNITVWRELLDDRYNFTASRAFPLFVSRAARWLAGEDLAYSYLKAGRFALDEMSEFQMAGRDNSATRLLGADYAPPRAGAISPAADAATRPQWVSLLSEAASTGLAGAELPVFAAAAGGLTGSSLLAMLLILAALALLAFEWYAYQRGRMP